MKHDVRGIVAPGSSHLVGTEKTRKRREKIVRQGYEHAGSHEREPSARLHAYADRKHGGLDDARGGAEGLP